MIVFDTEWGGLYDLDEDTNKVTKVLRCYHAGDIITYDRFSYHNHGQFIPATETQKNEWKHKYWHDDGTNLE